MAQACIDRLIDLRRDLHRHPEPAWREVYTTARIVEELERIGVDAYYLGADAIAPEARWGVPEDQSEFDRYAELAAEDGARREILDRIPDGLTGVVAVLERGPGPHVAVRVDIDALFLTESSDSDHVPAAEGFRSAREGLMHACGHDGHVAIGVGILETITDSDFSGRLTVCFQPAEEEIGGGYAITESGHLDDVDYLLAVHVGLGLPTGEVVAGYDRFLAVTNMDVTITGVGAHAAAKPEAGRNAIHALATMIENLYGISRHSAGVTRVNVGSVSGGSASNIVAEEARLSGEVRGETVALREHMKERARSVVEGAASIHGCSADLTFGPEAPSAQSDGTLAEIVADVAAHVEGVTTIHSRKQFRGSEDATYLMQHVQERGGLATYVGVGTDHPGGHHTGTFDIDEESIRIGVEILADTVSSLSSDRVAR